MYITFRNYGFLIKYIFQNWYIALRTICNVTQAQRLEYPFCFFIILILSKETFWYSFRDITFISTTFSFSLRLFIRYFKVMMQCTVSNLNFHFFMEQKTISCNSLPLLHGSFITLRQTGNLYRQGKSHFTQKHLDLGRRYFRHARFEMLAVKNDPFT